MTTYKKYMNELVEASKAWFGNDIPFHHFIEFKKGDS